MLRRIYLLLFILIALFFAPSSLAQEYEKVDSPESCKTHLECGAGKFCISNVKGQKGSSSCVSIGQRGTNAICEEYANEGVAVHAVCQSKQCNPISLTCEAAPSANPDSSNSCESEDNNDKAFRCIVGGCSGAYSEEYKGTFSSCANGQICCMNRSIYAKRSAIPPQKGSGSDNKTQNPNITSTPGSERCADKGGIDVARGGPTGFLRSLCDSKPYDANEAKTAKPGRKYSELYACKNGNEEVFFPEHNKICDEYPWLDNRIPTTCKEPYSGGQIDCSQFKDRECTKDFESNDYSCVKKGYRWCELLYKDGKRARGEEIIASGSCRGPSIIGGQCGEDIQCKDFPDAICVNTQNPGLKLCQWAGGVAPSPTPGGSTSCKSGYKQTGCPCNNIPGVANDCSSDHVCKGSWEYTKTNNSYCVPFSTASRWCERSQQLLPDEATCVGSPVYTTPEPTPDITAGYCPNDGNHLCVNPISNPCIAGYGPKNNAQADQACQEYTQFAGAKCYIKGATPDPSCTTQSSKPTPAANATLAPTPPGCPIDNGDGRVNSCQEKCGVPYPNPKPDGNAACANAYGSARGFCCTSN